MNADDQPALFQTSRPRRERKPLEATNPVLAEYLAAWVLEYGRPLRLPSFAETARHAKVLGEMIPDAELRKAFLAAYLRDTSPFLRREEHPLRFALASGYARWRRAAEWAVAERRRFVAASPGPVQPATYRHFGRLWRVKGLNRDGVEVATHTVSAVTLEAAKKLATGWWLTDAPYGISSIDVEPQ